MEAEPNTDAGQAEPWAPAANEWLGPERLTFEVSRRIGADTIMFTLAGGSALVVSVLLLVVYTNYMPPAEYGRLAILLFSASLLTVLLNLIPLAGILRWVYVAGDAAIGAADDPDRQAPGGTKRRALGTGCWMCLASIMLGCAVLIPFARPLSRLLLGSGVHADWVLLAIASGAAGSLFRLTSNVVRMERRPIPFSIILTTRGVVTAAVAIPLVVSGDGITGVLIGTTAGSVLPGIAAVFIARDSYSTDFSWADARQITDLGAKYIFVIIGLFVVHNSDAFMLSRFASDAEAGVYRVATRLASLISYLVSAFLLAWAPLERSTLFQATYELHGKSRVHRQLVTYYLLCGLTVVLALTLSGDLLVRLSPPQYRGAANLIPFASFGFVVYGLFVVIARTTYHKHRDLVHNASAALGAVIYIGVSALLVPHWGGYGLAIAVMVGMGFACACFRAINRTASHYAPIDWPRAVGTTLIVLGCIALGDAQFVGHGPLHVLFLVIDMLVIYPAALLATGIVSPAEARGMGQLLVPLLPGVNGRGGERAATARALTTLGPDDIRFLHQLTKGRRRVDEIAAEAGLPVSVVEARAGELLRRLTGAAGSERDDGTIGNWLFSGKTSAEHDVVMHYLERYGIDIMTLQRVEAASAAVRRLPLREWPLPADPEQMYIGTEL